MSTKAIAAACALLGGVLGMSSAGAACSGDRLNQTQLATAFSGNTVCAVRGGDRWQEFHQPGGTLIDWKLGPSHPVDPTDPVGTWSIVGTGINATLVHNYGAGGTYTFAVYNNGGGSYSFCSGGTEQLVTVRAGQGACP